MAAKLKIKTAYSRIRQGEQKKKIQIFIQLKKELLKAIFTLTSQTWNTLALAAGQIVIY